MTMKKVGEDRWVLTGNIYFRRKARLNGAGDKVIVNEK